MKNVAKFLIYSCAVLITVLASCSPGAPAEEAGTAFSINQSCDISRNGVRLIMSYDKVSASFKGTVENISTGSISAVRVEIHLDNGVELGPTPNISLNASEKKQVTLDASGQSFTRWTPHSETGTGGGV